MQRRHVHFPENIWQRLMVLSEKEDVAIADILRRLLSASLGLDEATMAQVELEADQGDPLPRIKRDTIKTRIEMSKLANTVARLRVDLDTLAESEGPRMEAWEGLKTTVGQLHADTQAHIDRAEGLHKQTAQTLAALSQGLKDVQDECGALRHAITQLGALSVDVLRRLRANEQGGTPDAEAQEAIDRGQTWLSRLEADVLAQGVTKGTVHG